MNRIVDYENLSRQIQTWIIDYADKYNIKTLVIGVSGGIDSAVVSTLCALTGIDTIAVGMPINSNSDNTKLSKKQLDYLNVKFGVRVDNIDLSPIYNSFNKLMSPNFSSDLTINNF